MKTIIITGASSGIGEALAKEYAKRQFNLVLAARDIDKLHKLTSNLEGVEALCVKTDVSKEDDCKRLIDETIAKFGKIDILINNAGISMRALFEDVDLNVIRELMNVNFWGTVYCTKYALPYILQQKGSIVGIISVAGHIGLPGRTGYSASKYAVRGFLDALRVENLKKGLHVLVVAPGFTRSNIRKVALTADGSRQGETPRNEDKMMTSEMVAKIIAIGIEKRKRSMILTFVEGKLTVFLAKWLPSLIDKLSFNHIAKEPNSPFK